MKGITSQRRAELLLAALIIARSTSYLFSKTCLLSMGPFTLLSLRFIAAFAFLMIFFWKRLLRCGRRTIWHGALLGAAFFSVMTAEMFGLRVTASSTVSLLENTAIVFVPFMQAALKRRAPDLSAVISTGIAFGGVALLTLGSGSFSLTGGELLCILASLLYAGCIILTDRLSRQDDPLDLGVLQVGFMGLFSLAAAFFLETPRLPQSGAEWVSILVLAIVCSGFGFTLQPVAQSGTTAERAGLFCALNPACAAVLGVVFLNEVMGPLQIVGALLVLSGIMVPRLLDLRAGAAKRRDALSACPR
jgi:drug/metabolite transporter (DMT)-like permease